MPPQRFALVMLLSLVLLACSNSKSNPSDCNCHMANGAVVMSWECYCAAHDCDRHLAARSAPCSPNPYRYDYPTCDLISVRVAGTAIESVYDSTGVLVGASEYSDLASFSCPSSPNTTSNTLRAGQFPDATCSELACGTCWDSSFPCATDGSTTDGG